MRYWDRIVNAKGADALIAVAKPRGVPMSRKAIATAALAAAPLFGILSFNTRMSATVDPPGSHGGMVHALFEDVGVWPVLVALMGFMAVCVCLLLPEMKNSRRLGTNVRKAAQIEETCARGAPEEPLLDDAQRAGCMVRHADEGSERGPASAFAGQAGARKGKQQGRALSSKRAHMLEKRARRLEKTGGLVNAWIATLALRGIDVIMNGQDCRLKLHDSGFDILLLGSEVLPIINLAFHLDGKVLTLVVSGGVSGVTTERFHIELCDADTALELALTLKVLRGAADTGAGVLAWSDRSLDQIGRPPPAE